VSLILLFIAPDTSVKNFRGFTALDMLLNNHQDLSLAHIIAKRDKEGWIIPDDLDVTKQFFTRNNQCLKIMIDSNAYRCLSISLTLALMTLPDETRLAINSTLASHFLQEGLLRAHIIGSY
jgi:hypothetical protein